MVNEIRVKKEDFYSLRADLNSLLFELNELEKIYDGHSALMKEENEGVAINLPKETKVNYSEKINETDGRYLIVSGYLIEHKPAMCLYDDDAKKIREIMNKQYESIIEKQKQRAEEAFCKLKASSVMLNKETLFETIK